MEKILDKWDDKQKIVKLYRLENQFGGRRILELLFGAEYFSSFPSYPPTRVKTYEEACKVKGIKPLLPEQFLFLPEDQRSYYFNHHQLITIVDVLNGGRKPDYTKSDEKRYEVYFWVNDEAAGGPGFSYSGYGCDRSDSGVGARLTFFDPETAKYAAETFLSKFEVIIKQ